MRRAAFVMIATGLLAGGGWAAGQQAQYQKVPNPPNIRSGADIGFRVEGTENGKAVGRLVVRLKSGEWVDVQLAPGPRVVPLAK